MNKYKILIIIIVILLILYSLITPDYNNSNKENYIEDKRELNFRQIYKF
jgi:hypothetical protein